MKVFIIAWYLFVAMMTITMFFTMSGDILFKTGAGLACGSAVFLALKEAKDWIAL